MQLTSTYRLQLHGGFTFDHARQICDYLKELGISHVYCSPYLQAVKGSMHGYDVVDHARVNQELGGEEGLQAFLATLREQGLGQVLDIVPNHMAIGTRRNTLWWDVLENGPASEYADFFDVDWNPPESKLRDTVLLPILGDHYGRVLEKGELKLDRESGKFVIRYHDEVLPTAPESTVPVLWHAAEQTGSDELAFLADSALRLPRPTWTDAPNREKRHRDKEVIAGHLRTLCEREPEIAAAIGQALDRFNADYDALDSILSSQNYRLSHWRAAQRDLGYRRFFDVNTLIGLRMENERVFRRTHRRILDWVRAGVLQGLRVDHPDGLRDPQAYFDRLRQSAPEAWVVAEKILEPGEQLRRSWPIAGTTGYDFLYRSGSLLIDPAGETPLSDFYAEFTGETVDIRQFVRARKLQVLASLLGSDVNGLTAQFLAVCEQHRCYRDYTRHEIHDALLELIACFPVYRTYVQAEKGVVAAEDERYVREAAASAKANRPDVAADLFDFLASVLLLKVRGSGESEFVMRFQQFTGPAMAKGVEDTTFYAYNRLLSLNEVGGDTSAFGISVERFHQLSAESFEHWPQSMLTTSTHDTKRSEDVRARISLISEIPEQWIEAVRRWSAHNQKHKRKGFPDCNMEYLFYQSLFGAWPISQDRMAAYMEKSSREAKTHTSWTEKNAEYDEALQAFVAAAFEDTEFQRDMEAFTAPLIWPGRINSLALALLRLTAPGVPDQYQGLEIWDLSLVDPDNRRPVDYDLRRKLLRELPELNLADILSRADEGLPKLLVTRNALLLRRERPEVFQKGKYEALPAAGPYAGHVVAFARGGEVVTVVPRLTLKRNGDWGDTSIHIPDGLWCNRLTGERREGGRVTMAELLRPFPVALLARETSR